MLNEQTIDSTLALCPSEYHEIHNHPNSPDQQFQHHTIALSLQHDNAICKVTTAMGKFIFTQINDSFLSSVGYAMRRRNNPL